MSLSTQFRKLGQQASAFRQEMFGTDDAGKKVTIDYNRGQFPAIPAYYSPIKDKSNTEEAGFIDDHDSIVRIPKATAPATFTPELNKQIKLMEGPREILLTINEILGTHVASSEWMLGCDAQN